ncbi:hypothetical protein [Pinisolibacter aquiterrae]|uniref:hypothetical protein n=1 Tax=Pinisolibacter aquiterrae TaxID=2815579 RepID=UPI001C3E3C9F|nr:hypothetical protein [Pinisolibacter aquiterrae]MBV5266213.1 hypothetical protein [Pinisolibacter aquiterrae]MCC8236301.1 hypothetical protein [Pinisolibacter aquiterrae]
MRIGPTLGVSILASRPDGARRVEPSARASETGEERGRALVPVAPAAESRSETGRIVRHRVEAPFLAQLIASHRDLPEQRRLRRAEPAVATAIYAKAQAGEGLLVPGYLVDEAR